MRKIVLLLVLVLSVTLASQAQNVRYGVKAGLNFSDLDADGDFSDTDTRIAPAVGFFAEIGLADDLKFQPEFLYSAQGGKQESARVDYLQLPLLLKYNLTKIINIQLGPQPGIKIHEFEDGYKNFEFAGLGGIGLDLNDNFTIEARYAFGLSDIIDAEAIDAKNRYLQVLVAFKL
ncbi:porin family protein [Croceiramulus getboli]|nr:porin family protein [Flavobacteriaceae bacterium YJPT1-3]